MRVTATPGRVVLLSMTFAVLSVVGGILLALGGSVPISPYITTLSFVCYGICRVIAAVRARHGTVV
jgi:zinc/manganese transport system permease protein